MAATYFDLSRAGVQNKTSEATTSRVVYTLDPDGHLVQVMPSPVLEATHTTASVHFGSSQVPKVQPNKVSSIFIVHHQGVGSSNVVSRLGVGQIECITMAMAMKVYT